MTIEIRELVIRAVAETPSGEPAHARAAAHSIPHIVAAPAPHDPALTLDREALVARCVREVLRELRKSRER